MIWREKMNIPSGEIDFLGVGELLVDFISREETDWLYNAFTFRKYQGGSPANIAANIAKLGGTSAIVAKTGIGAMAKFLKQQLLRAGVNCDHIVMDHHVHTSIVFVSRTSRTADSEAFRSGDYQLRPEEVQEKAIKNAKVVHASTWSLSREPCRTAVRRAFKLAAKHGRIISFDPNYNPDVWPEYRQAHRVIGEVLDLANLVKASKDDAIRLFGRSKSDEQYIELFHQHGPETVIFTMGADGVLISTGGDITHLPARKITVSDATGAGDAFWAGFLVALLDGHPLTRCAYVAREIVEQKLQIVGPLPDDIDRQKVYKSVEGLLPASNSPSKA
jgi:fructokinase